MHIPDGFLDTKTSMATGAIAIGGLGACIRRVRREADDLLASDRHVEPGAELPLAGLTAAFVFAVQMLNFPVVSGTSGHLLGGVLAAVLVGPWLGSTCVAVVLAMQALFFADGGLSALGTNVVNMALIGALGGYVVFLAVRRLAGNGRGAVVAAAGVAAGLAPAMAAVAFTFEYAVGGNDAASVSTVAWAMIGVHLLIGIGEGLITAAAVSSVLAVRPDLVHGARGLSIRVAAPLVPAAGDA